MELFKLFGTIAITNADANEAIDDTTDRAEQSENKISSAFKKIGTAVATYFAVDKVKDFGLNCINAAADAEAASSQFSQVFGDIESKASKSLKGIADNTGIQVNRMKGSYTQIAAFAKTTGMDTESALSLADRAMAAVADSAAFYDRSLEDTTESLQSFLKGNYENDAALGLSCTETTRNAAANKLYGKSFNELSESQKQLTLLQMVEDANKASGALGQAAREADTWTNQTGNLKQAWTDFQAVLGKNVLPLAVEGVKKAANTVQTLSNKLPGIIQNFKKWSPLIAGVAAGFAALKISMGISSLISSVTTAWMAYKTANEGATLSQWLLNAAMNANPIVLIVTLIAGLVAAVVVLWNTNEGFRNKVIEIWESIKNAFGTAIEAIKGFFTGLVEKVNSVWDTIKQSVTDVFNAVKESVSSAWETIKNVVQVGVMLIAEILTAAFELITLPFRFIWENCKEYIIAAWNTIKSTVSNTLNAIKTAISNVWNTIAAFLGKILNNIKNIITTAWNAYKSIVESNLNKVKSIVTTVWNAIKNVIQTVLNAIKSVVTSILNAVKSKFSSVWNSIKSTVSGAINRVKSVISSGLNSAKNTVSNVLNAIKSKFSSIFESAKNIVSNAIETIKGFFNFSWSLPDLKLPHFSISGSFSLNPPSVPSFGIEWYAKAMEKGMIMNEPTIFGYNPNNGKLLAGGEAGSETVVGTENLMNMIKTAVNSESNKMTSAIISCFDRLFSVLSEYFPQFANMRVVLDNGALVGEITPEIDEELEKIRRRREGR